MRMQRVKETAELAGIVAILVTLILIWLQIRQAQLIAVADFNVSLASIGVDTGSWISEHSDVWSRGIEGAPLTDSERVIFEQIAANLDSRWFIEHRHMTRLGELEQAEAIINDWSAYLYERPGLRATWLSRIERLNENRRILSPDSEATFGWVEAIEAKWEELEQAGK
jgi:hypothetical protein